MPLMLLTPHTPQLFSGAVSWQSSSEVNATNRFEPMSEMNRSVIREARDCKSWHADERFAYTPRSASTSCDFRRHRPNARSHNQPASLGEENVAVAPVSAPVSKLNLSVIDAIADRAESRPS